MANKKITDLQLRDNVTADVNLPGDDGIQTYRVTAQQLKDFIRPMPVGALCPFAGSSAPTGFLLCDGSAVSRSTYSDLFDVISTAYGSGDGSTTFNLPDLRGRTAVGKDNMGGSAASRATSATLTPNGTTLGAVGGTERHTLTTAEMPSHTHTQNAHTHTQDAHTHNEKYFDNSGGFSAGSGYVRQSTTSASNTNLIDNNATVTATNQNTTATNQNTGGGDPHLNLQPSIILNYLIKH